MIDAEKADHPTAFACRLLQVMRSSSYAWTNRVETRTKARRGALAVEVATEFDASRSATTAGGRTRRSATALRAKPSPTTAPRRP